ncbi:MAG: anion permease, partial [Planctomycetes bacterium]|nr:anion permease [Planctomycetota bacterium]
LDQTPRHYIQGNTMLLPPPRRVSGGVMPCRRGQVRKYLEQDVEWNVVIFLMMLFMIAGALERTQVTDVIAGALDRSVGSNPSLLLPTVLAISAIGSAFIENIVFVAAFMPVVVKLDQTPLIWALLHGACLGGNITMVGSTANIVAVGMLEKRYWTKVHFWMWLKTGLIVGIVSCLISWIGLTILSPHMPTRAERIATELRYDAGASAEESATGR